jgi:hypothetical protein
MLRTGLVRLTAICAAAVMLILTTLAASAQSTAPQARKQTSVSAQKRTSPKPAVTASSPHQLEPRALGVLKSVRDRLAVAHTLSFIAVDTWESRTDEDAGRTQQNRFEVTLKRPDKLRVLVSSDAGLLSQVNCNGRTRLTYTPITKAISITNAPPLIVDCLKDAYKTSVIDFPIADLIVAARSSDFASGLQRAHYISQSPFRGTNTDVISFSRDSVLVQMWVGTEDQLPRAIRVTSDSNRSRHMLTLSDWHLDMAVPPDVFTGLKGVTAEHVDATPERPVGTSGIQSAPAERPLTLHTYGPKYWGSGGSTPPTPYSAPGYYQSPDGYGYYPQQGYAVPPASAGNYGEPCYDCGEYLPEGAPEPGFNISLRTSGWYQPQAPQEENLPAGTYFPGQIVSKLPVGCASPYPGPAFYLCGSTWFAGILGPDGNLYFRVVGGYGY